MLSVIRRLLVLLLLVSLPVQGWAASRMGVAMLAPADCCAGHDAGHATTHAAHSSANASAHSSAHTGHAADGGHGSCGENCHCCISMALPAMTPLLKVQSPPADWQGVAGCAFAQISAPTPDKPPKG